jgi:hypothetical protein
VYSMRLLLQMGTGDERYSLWSVYDISRYLFQLLL